MSNFFKIKGEVYQFDSKACNRITIAFVIINIILALLIFSPSSAAAQLSEQQQDEIINEVILTCIEKLELEGTTITDHSMRQCGSQQLPAAMFSAIFIFKVKQLEEGPAKDIFKGMVMSCIEENRLPSGRLDQLEVAKCLKLKTELLDYMTKQYMKDMPVN